MFTRKSYNYTLDRLKTKYTNRLKILTFLLFTLWFLISNTGNTAEKFFQSSAPEDDPNDLTIWPNTTSRANSDSWIADNHDKIRLMQPRILVINFSNEKENEYLLKMLGKIIDAVGESTRYHGYKDPHAPPFLKYKVFKYVDLRDADKKVGNSSKVPFKAGMKSGFNIEYNRFFSDEFAKYYEVENKQKPGTYLRLDELVDRGYVHEVWFFAEHVKDFGAFEVVELKPVYDDQFRKVGNKYVQAGNGGDPEQKWMGRSLRIGFINPSRGIGCFMESLSHGIEGMANSGAIPYFTKYFKEFAGMNLRQRFPQFKHSSFYALGPNDRIDYPDPKTAVIKIGDSTIILSNYVAYGGNVHFMPNGRFHYDLSNLQKVMSTIEDWRIGSGVNGEDMTTEWSIDAFKKYRDFAPDCMGPWLIYWRQNFPGLDNRQKDDNGKPMKNWWVFLFY